MNRQEALARVANIRKQLAKLSEEHRKALDASDWETCTKLQDQLARKVAEVKAQ